MPRTTLGHIGVAHNTIQETGDLTNHAEMVLRHPYSDEDHRQNLHSAALDVNSFRVFVQSTGSSILTQV